MSPTESGKIAFFVKSTKDVFSFFFALAKKSRRTKIFFVLSFLPVFMALVVKFSQIFQLSRDIEGLYIFNNMIIAFYLQFLILILALFYGSSVTSEELEGKTLTYLTTRPVSKSAIIVGKYLAYTVMIIFMVTLGVVFSFLVLNLNDLLDVGLYRVLFRDVAVLALGLMCYTAFFTFIGTILKKSIMFGLIFSFGWENVIQYFPGSTQKFTIVHYLKSLLPSVSRGRFSFLLFRLEPSSTGTSIFMLFLIAAVFIAIGCVLFTYKEYILKD
jgi:ABC-type transport system involved in multi-copper enzyme maturation permease subunit